MQSQSQSQSQVSVLYGFTFRIKNVPTIFAYTLITFFTPQIPILLSVFSPFLPAYHFCHAR